MRTVPKTRCRVRGRLVGGRAWRLRKSTVELALLAFYRACTADRRRWLGELERLVPRFTSTA